MKHTIQILPADEPGRFALVGAVEIEDTDSPINEHDTLHVTGADCSIADQPLWKLAADYRPPRKSDVARQARH